MKYGIFDAHCDTISKIYETNQGLSENNCHIDFKRMSEYEKYTQVFAVFVDRESILEGPKTYVEKLITRYKEETERGRRGT